MKRFLLKSTRSPWLWTVVVFGLLLGAFAGMNAASAAETVESGGYFVPSPTAGGDNALASADGAGAASDEDDGVSSDENVGGGGGKNVVRLVNHTDGGLRVKGNIQLNRIPGPTVEPANLAFAYASCTDCQTIAVAMQINLIRRGASRVTPENAAFAVNYECSNCRTVALAYQYVYSVDDPTQTPKEVSDLIREMDRELNTIHSDKSVTLEEAANRIDAVIARFHTLAQSLDQARDEAVETTSADATPIPTLEPTATTGTAQPTATTETAQPTASATADAEGATSPDVPAESTPSPTATTPPAASPTSASSTPPPSSLPTATTTSSPTPTPVE